MPMKERKTSFDFTPFPYELEVVVTDDLEASRDKWAKDIVIGKLRPLGATKALTMTHPEWDFACIFLRTNAMLEEIAHEVTHAIQHFARYIEMQPNDEFMAYYIGHYTHRIAAFVLAKHKQR